MTTIGGAEIVIRGSSLGTNESVISVMYGGNLAGAAYRSYTAINCRIRRLNAELSCTSVAGVGGNYRVQVTVDGGSSEWSADRLSYAAPTIVALGGPGAFQGPAKVGSGRLHTAAVSSCFNRRGFWVSVLFVVWLVVFVSCLHAELSCLADLCIF